MQAPTMRALRKYNADIAYLFEVKVLADGHSRFLVRKSATISTTVVENSANHGGAIKLSESAQTTLLVWISNSSRLGSACLKEITVVEVSTAKLDAEKEAKNSFYDELQGVVDSAPSGGLIQRTRQHATSCASLLWNRGEVMVYSLPAVLDNDSISCFLYGRHRDDEPTVELLCRLRLTSIPSQLMRRRLRWFGHAARLPNNDQIRNIFLSAQPPRS